MSGLLEALLACGAVKFGDFTLASGARSPYYVDIKLASTDPKVLRLMGDGLAKRVGGAARIAGMELGAVPLAAATSLACGVPYLMVRKKAKEHGTSSRIEGPFRAGEEVVIVEDVTTSGGSALEALRVLREAGLKVTKVVTVVDREQGAAANFAKEGVAFESLVTAKQLLEARK